MVGSRNIQTGEGAKGEIQTSTAGGGTGRPLAPARRRTGLRLNNRSRKRRRRCEDEGGTSDDSSDASGGGGGTDEDAGDAYTQRHHPLSSDPGAARDQLFACHFYKLDPIRHIQCLSFTLKRHQDVKQHLQRRHCPPTIYCPICQESFSCTTQRDHHIRQKECVESSSRTDPPAGCISSEKQEALRKRMRGSDIAIWYQIWHILFDGVAPPTEPYRTTVIEEVAGILERLWRQHQSEIISNMSGARRYEAKGHPIPIEFLSSLVSSALSQLVSRLPGALRHVDHGGPMSRTTIASEVPGASTASTGSSSLVPFGMLPQRLVRTTAIQHPERSSPFDGIVPLEVMSMMPVPCYNSTTAPAHSFVAEEPRHWLPPQISSSYSLDLKDNWAMTAVSGTPGDGTSGPLSPPFFSACTDQVCYFPC